jgi:hypothetical protein
MSFETGPFDLPMPGSARGIEGSNPLPPAESRTNHRFLSVKGQLDAERQRPHVGFEVRVQMRVRIREPHVVQVQREDIPEIQKSAIRAAPTVGIGCGVCTQTKGCGRPP